MESSKQHVIVDDVNLAGLFHFHRILWAVTMAFQPPRLVIGLIMVAALMVGGMTADWASGRVFASVGSAGGLAQGADLKPFEAAVSFVVANFNALVRGVAHLEVATVFNAAGNLLIALPTRLWAGAPLFTIFYGLYVVIVLAVGGGALARMTACEFAGRPAGGRIAAGDALQFAARNWWRLVMAPLLPLIIVGALALILILLGWFFMLPGLKLVGGPMYGLALLAGLVIAFLLLGYAVGFPLLVPAVACENCDPADALQRSYAYVLARPLHLLGYGATALVGLTLGYLIVSLIAVAVLNTTGACVSMLGDSVVMEHSRGYELFDLSPHPFVASPASPAAPAGEASWAQRWALGWVGFWQTIVVGLVVAYVFTYFFAASTIVYLLMRRASDGQDVTEIWQPGMIPGTYASVAPRAPSAGDITGAPPSDAT